MSLETTSEESGPSFHYTLAHFALRTVALADPLRFLAIVASPDGFRFLQSLIDQVADHLKTDPPFDVSEISFHPRRVKNLPCIVLVMPSPTEVAEAYMVACVLMSHSGKPLDANIRPDDVTGRYFTLEKGFHMDGSPRTVLAEWDRQGSHSNFGDGPDVTVDAFLEALAGFNF
ncbi:MAG: hypothetical protein KDA91_02475 [Planctomycetaceae bacterium]|nr:hypothetical protein [Planctomycetaceae bacterium]